MTFASLERHSLDEMKENDVMIRNYGIHMTCVTRMHDSVARGGVSDDFRLPDDRLLLATRRSGFQSLKEPLV